jgi:ATP-dependent helicase/nuclease subunit B
LQEIADKLQEKPLGAPLLLLVPEQATFQSERALVTFPGVGASLRAQAVSFSGLYRLLATERAFPKLPRLDEQGRAMLLTACVREKLADLRLLNNVAANVSFVDSLARTLVEFEQYKILPEQLCRAAEQVEDELLAAKLADLALIYQDYLQVIEGGFRDQGVMMNELAEAAADSELLQGAEIWLDGFLDFNPSQLAVLRAILPKAAAVNICLCLPDRGAARIFTGQRTLRHMFMQLARELGADVEIVKLTANFRMQDNPELSAVESAFSAGRFGSAGIPELAAKAPRNIHIVAAADVRSEAVLAARIISRLCREDGYKFREIAVITRNLADYQLALENAFRDFEIPYFMDMGQDVSKHPLVKLVSTALAVLAENWATPSVLAYLKSGLTPISAEEADVLENYALRVGLKYSMWRKAGNFRRGSAEELPLINEIAARALKPLLHLQEKLKKSENVAAYAEGVLEFLQELGVEQHLNDWANRAISGKELRLADAHRQILPKVEQLLHQLADFLGDMPADARRFAELWQEGAARLQLSSIPPSDNEVKIAEINRSRLPEIRASIVLGMNEGSLPAVASEDGLLGSSEREKLAGLGLELGIGGRQKQFLEDYLVYIALTRSSEQLFLSYAETATDGSAKASSPVLADLRQVFPLLQVVREEELPLSDFLGGDRLLLSGLAAHLAGLKDGEQAATKTQNADEFWRETCRELQREGRMSAELAVLQQGLGYTVDRAPLDKHRLNSLYDNLGQTSVSRLERFNSCPCQYYAAYGLDLQPRAEFKLQTADIGSLYHYILAEVMQKLVQANCDWAAVTVDELEPLILQAVKEFSEAGEVISLADILADSGKNSYVEQKIISVVSQTLLDMAANLASGSFRPLALELSFGMGGRSKLEPISIELDDGRKIRLRGQIDRVDSAQGTGAEFVRIIDYKMRNKTLKAADIFYGLNWQLPFYLDALLQNGKKHGRNFKPAGMFYVPVQEIIKNVKSLEEEGAALRLQGLAILDMEALVLAERDFEPGSHAKTMQVHLKKDCTYGRGTQGLTMSEYAFMQDSLRKMAKERLDEILGGEIRQRPIIRGGKPICEYCDYYAMCAVDLAVDMDGCVVEDLSKDEVLRRLADKYDDKLTNKLIGKAAEKSEINGEVE